MESVTRHVIFPDGNVRRVDELEAKYLVESGQAKYHGPPPIERAVVRAPETRGCACSR